MRKATVMVMAALAISLFAAEVHAQYEVRPGTNGYERVTGRVFDLGTEHLLLVHFMSSSEPAVSAPGVSTESMYVAYMGGLVPRYFVINNLAIGLSLNVLYQSNTITMTTPTGTNVVDSSDLGFIGFLMINYYLRLGYSLFFKPGIGLGGFYASRETPYDDGAGLKLQTDLYGFAGRIDLGLVYYAGQHFNLRAGIDILIRAGYESRADGSEGDSFYSVDAAFGAGLGYSF